MGQEERKKWSLVTCGVEKKRKITKFSIIKGLKRKLK
jgi:hypothetical protein